MDTSEPNNMDRMPGVATEDLSQIRAHSPESEADLPAIEVGQTFASLDDVKKAVEAHAYFHNWVLHTRSRDKSRIILKCRSTKDCPFHLRAEMKDSARISSIKNTHTCEGAEPVQRQPASYLDFLVRELPKVMRITTTTDPQDIHDVILRVHKQEVQLSQCRKVRTILAGPVSTKRSTAHGRMSGVPASRFATARTVSRPYQPELQSSVRSTTRYQHPLEPPTVQPQYAVPSPVPSEQPALPSYDLPSCDSNERPECSTARASAPRGRKTWLIVGASRGIGYEFVRQLLNCGDRVFASVRNPSPAHNVAYWTKYTADPRSLRILECDMLDEQSLDALATNIEASMWNVRIDYVVINAGVLRYPNRATEIAYNDFAFHLHTNTIGPLICAQRLLRAQIDIGTIAFMSSDSGSAQAFRDMEDGFAAYAASKAALNQGLRHMAAELKRKGEKTTILALHPGEVKTDMANIHLDWAIEGQMTPEQSVAACVKVIESKDERDSGTFWTYENKMYPW